MELPLVGRKRERAYLLSQIEAVFHGADGLVLVEGEAGLGKTRLLQAVAQDARWRGAQIFLIANRDVPGERPYGGLVQSLREALSPVRAGQLVRMLEPAWLLALRPVLPELAARLPDNSVTLQALNPGQERRRLHKALAQFLAAWARLTPLVLIIEDLHWADPDTLNLLRYLIQKPGVPGQALIASYRPDEA
jgi:predicted ATPase